ncbi:MAG: PQQ-dependent sugar dehydrogenase [Betaproteobacteria bacterium]|nr:MAG: PQQ-dependent sugar dehydrogenase [Betaproteobacteria bacterium]
MRMWRTLAVAAGLLLPAACGKNSGGDMPPFEMRLQQVFGSAAGLSSPIDLQAPPGDSRLFIAERPGRIRVVQGGVLQMTPFLDISSRVTLQGEAGLLSFAFDPQYSTNGFVYVHFIENIPNTTGDIVVERYHVSSDPNVLQTPGTEVIRIPHRDANNHYGGRVAFGPDGMLYLSAGDGGGGNNQFMHAQDAASHLGKLLRIDVSALPYAIPPDNPVWPGVGRNENWAIGLRNPFRYAFDAGQLYIADVGQDQREEIDVVSASASGLNYGWSIMEGTLCLAIGGPCSTPGLTAPVYDYDHAGGRCAIIGGYVYRGAAIPALQGKYLFSDLCTGFVRSLSLQNNIATVSEEPNANVGTPFSFGQDGSGELYVLTADNRVLKIVSP